jgi:hypothetical protein
MPAWYWWAVGVLILVILVEVVRAVLVEAVTRRRRGAPPATLSPLPPATRGTLSAGDDVQFTVYRPRAVAPDRWYTLLAFAHLAAKPAEAPADEPDPVEEVRRQATRVLGEREVRAYQIVTQDAPQSVPREETLTFVPGVPGVEFNPPRRSFRWTEAAHREEFRLRAASYLAGQTARGRLSVFLGDLLLAEVPLAIPVAQGAGASGGDSPAEAESARRYRKIFASYSHKDRHVVEQIERLAQALGDEYLRDWKDLRAGEVWDERLLHMIEEADVFQLFWSREAMESEYVRREYEYALSLNRANFVRPTYWEDPLPSDPARGLPPAALLRLNFQRVGPFLQPTLPAHLEPVEEALRYREPFRSLLLRLGQAPTEVREGVEKAVLVAEIDPEMALTRVRKVLEYVVRQVYERRVSEPAGTRPLENLLQRLQKDGHLPARLAPYANAVRELGNVGTHRFGERVTEVDVRQSLSQLVEVVEWYLTAEGPAAPTPRKRSWRDPGPRPSQGARPWQQGPAAPNEGRPWSKRTKLALVSYTLLGVVAAIGIVVLLLRPPPPPIPVPTAVLAMSVIGHMACPQGGGPFSAAAVVAAEAVPLPPLRGVSRQTRPPGGLERHGPRTLP